jgi:hypothetical protein
MRANCEIVANVDMAKLLSVLERSALSYADATTADEIHDHTDHKWVQEKRPAGRCGAPAAGAAPPAAGAFIGRAAFGML